MGIPMWREPSKSEASKSALEKDASASARSSIRRGPSRHSSSRARRSDILASFHSQIIDELRRGAVEPRRVPRFSLIPPNGPVESTVTLEQAEREALNWAQSRAASAPRQTDQPTETANRRFRNYRDQALADLLGRMDAQPRNSHHYLNPFRQRRSSPPMRDRYNSDNLSNTQRRPTRDPVVDGLGDRQRSPSPDGERETDAWETLLSTITPDATLPSTDTSFTSTSAAGPDISRNGRPRSSITLTQPLSVDAARAHFGLDPFPDHLNPCDFSSSDDEDPSSESTGQAGMTLSSRRPPDQRSTMSNHPPVSIPTIIPASVLALSDGRQQSFFSDRHQNDDLHHMQVILDRLARREDIPDDWWAAAGLARTLDRGLNASMESTDTEGVSRTNDN
ncbi:uncharacterized protein N7500_010883 [Penicillium coprophilum]|uniref:uncharacterized protein n=1 Tax=Penicillium coprophilum TaxID=36646 RepID=UPI00238B9C11|nr:uncharacterized protein N7500_010883 [Penicillium coprophilum]KAJ5150694.1 hypothetical protein N7500_010883 [Penicillium coprophilum]